MPMYIDRSKAQNFDFNVAEPRVSFNPERIIHCKYSFQMASATGGRVQVVFDKEIKTYVYDGDISKLEKFIKNVHNGIGNGPTTYDAPSPRNPKPTPFDFGLEKQSVVVIELDKLNNWIFSQKDDGIARKDDSFGPEDQNLRHVDPSTGVGRPQYFDKEDCRIVYFDVYERTDKLERLFKFNVRFVDRGIGVATETVIDPDIPNTGANPTIP